MDRLKKIIVGVDFSPCSAAALKQAARIAKLNRAQVTALHVVQMPVSAIPDGMFLPIEMPSADMLFSGARRRWAEWPAAREVGESVAFDVALGLPRTELLEHVRSGSVDLLVLGAHGEFDAKRGVGSIAAACVQRARTKVLIVRDDKTDAFKSIAACVDFTDTARLVLEQAIRVAALDNAALHVLHVYEDPWRHRTPPKDIQENMPDFAKRYRHAVERHLHAFCEPFAHEMAALKASFHALQFDGHGRGIVDFVEYQQCDLVALGTRAKWNARDFFWGSTAERVVREARCSALTVKPPGFE